MPPSSDNSIAKKARAKAEADFATWLMMAKLGGFDDLPSNAQRFLISYRTRLGTMSESESAALAVREVYSAYYSEMGGMGAAPKPKARTQKPLANVTRLRTGSQQDPSALRRSTSLTLQKLFPVLLIFGSLVALIFAYKFLAQ